MNFKSYLFIDDEREPANDSLGWVIVRSSQEAISWCESQNRVPSFISFDHDLGGKDTSMIFIHWMIEKDLDNPGFIPADFDYSIHSQNSVGQKNIQGLLDGYLAHRHQLKKKITL